jgi:hypothetical protein
MLGGSGGSGEATNATGLPTAARNITQRFGDLTFGITFVENFIAQVLFRSYFYVA